jgi:hypothetical protein
MQMLASLTTYAVVCLLCSGVAYLLNTEITNIVAFTALAMAVDSLTRVD